MMLTVFDPVPVLMAIAAPGLPNLVSSYVPRRPSGSTGSTSCSDRLLKGWTLIVRR
ncbi:hypothetical protein LINPERPRIM_LOCUS35285 [Linum perenne]